MHQGSHVVSLGLDIKSDGESKGVGLVPGSLNLEHRTSVAACIVIFIWQVNVLVHLLFYRL